MGGQARPREQPVQTPLTTTQILGRGHCGLCPRPPAASAAELLGLFAFASSRKINATRVIKNLIWRGATAIRAGQRPPIAGNLRSFWYTDIKPVLSRLAFPWRAAAPLSSSMTPLSRW